MIQQIDRPQPGYFAVTLVKGGPEVAAAIYLVPFTTEGDGEDARMERTPHLEAHVNGRPVEVKALWTRRRRTITQAEHDYLMEIAAWARRNAPNDPMANPTRPVNLAAQPPVF